MQHTNLFIIIGLTLPLVLILMSSYSFFSLAIFFKIELVKKSLLWLISNVKGTNFAYFNIKYNLLEYVFYLTNKNFGIKDKLVFHLRPYKNGGLIPMLLISWQKWVDYFTSKPVKPENFERKKEIFENLIKLKKMYANLDPSSLQSYIIQLNISTNSHEFLHGNSISKVTPDFDFNSFFYYYMRSEGVYVPRNFSNQFWQWKFDLQNTFNMAVDIDSAYHTIITQISQNAHVSEAKATLIFLSEKYKLEHPELLQVPVSTQATVIDLTWHWYHYIGYGFLGVFIFLIFFLGFIYVWITYEQWKAVRRIIKVHYPNFKSFDMKEQNLIKEVIWVLVEKDIECKPTFPEIKEALVRRKVKQNHFN